jgi:hypothetical protein
MIAGLSQATPEHIAGQEKVSALSGKSAHQKQFPHLPSIPDGLHTTQE